MKSYARYERLRLPILGPLAVALIALFAVFFLAASLMQDHRIHEAATHDLSAAQQLYEQRIIHNADHLSAILEVMVKNQHMLEKLQQRDRNGLLEVSEPLFQHLYERYDITHYYFTDQQRINILRVHNPPNWGDVIDRASTLMAEKTGQMSWAVETGVFGSITLRVVRPVYKNGQLIGYLELGREIDYLLPEISRLLKINLAILIDKSFLQRAEWEKSLKKLGLPTDWDQFPEQVLGAITDQILPAELEDFLIKIKTPTQSVDKDILSDKMQLSESGDLAFALTKLHDGAGRQIGRLVLYKDLKLQYIEKYRFMMEASAVAGMIAFTLFGLFYFITGKVGTEIRSLNSRNRLILEAADEGIVGLDNQGCINFINPAAARMLGYTTDELIGHSYNLVYLGADKQNLSQEQEFSFSATLKEGSTQRVEQEVHVRKDGSEFSVEQVSAPIYEQGEQLGAVITFIDITQRLEQAQHIREGDIRMRAIVDNATDGIITVDSSCNILSLNPAVEHLFGYSAEELIGRNASLLLPDVMNQHHEACFEQYLTNDDLNDSPPRQDLDIFNKAGERITIRLSIREINLAGEKIFIGMLQDITLQKRAEQAIRDHSLALERSNQELQDFAYVASHDLQEPLRKIMAFGDRLASHNGKNLDEKGLDYLMRMRNAAERMRLLISSLLAYSRVESKAQPLQEVDLKDVLADVLSDLEHRIKESNAEIIVDNLPRVEVDPVQMHQLLQNLISNGLKFRRPDTLPQIEVRCRILLANDPNALPNHDVVQTCMIQIKDNGIGFDNKYLDRIFNIFQRLNTRDQYEGSGIGLAICRKIAERHKGVLDADGQLGAGATFTLKIPVKQPESLVDGEEQV